ncbi:hypothetical protein AMTRI_Chr05g67430 [Amborella trichopoda]
MTNGNSFSFSVIDFTSPFYFTNNDNPDNILVSHILEDIVNSIFYETTAQVMWDDLKDRFSQSYEPRLFKLRWNVALVYQGSSTISAYYTKLKYLWEELASYTLLPPCSCDHTIDTCYVLHGYPPGHRLHQPGKGTSSKPTINEKNIVATNSSQTSPQFTYDQYRRLSSMLIQGNVQPMVNFAGNSTSSPSSIPLHTWIVDIGASDHMIFDTSLFHSSTLVSYIAPVKLPNGSFASVTYIDSILLTPTLCLHQVLCVPSFGIYFPSANLLHSIHVQ